MTSKERIYINKTDYFVRDDEELMRLVTDDGEGEAHLFISDIPAIVEALQEAFEWTCR